jgi:hypothetical protein
VLQIVPVVRIPRTAQPPCPTTQAQLPSGGVQLLTWFYFFDFSIGKSPYLKLPSLRWCQLVYLKRLNFQGGFIKNNYCHILSPINCLHSQFNLIFSWQWAMSWHAARVAPTPEFCACMAPRSCKLLLPCCMGCIWMSCTQLLFCLQRASCWLVCEYAWLYLVSFSC